MRSARSRCLGDHRAHIGAELRPLDTGPDESDLATFSARDPQSSPVAFGHDHPAHRRTNLAGVEVDAPANVFLDQIVEVGILMDDSCRFAAEFENAGHHVSRSRRRDRDARFHGAGENDLVDVRMRA
jgi:hypothetical protein